MTHTTTHMIPIELAPARRAPLHFTWLGIAVLAAVVATLTLIVSLSLVTDHYGDASTLNAGYVLGTDTSAIELGWETAGNPGPFGHVKTPLGVLSYYGEPSGPTWCPDGATDVDCGA
jgi:hypothetical protein